MQVLVRFEVPTFLKEQAEYLTPISDEEYNKLPPSLQESYAYTEFGWVEMPSYAITNGWRNLRAMR